MIPMESGWPACRSLLAKARHQPPSGSHGVMDTPPGGGGHRAYNDHHGLDGPMERQ